MSNLAVEGCLVSKLDGLFRTRDILEMSPEDISRLSSESPDASSERERLLQKRDVLEKGLPALKGFQNRRNAFAPIQGRNDQVSELEDIQSEHPAEEEWTGGSGTSTSPPNLSSDVEKAGMHYNAS